MLKVSKIAFPGLGISEFEVDSVAFVIFGRPIAWYAIFITLGIAFCFFYVIWRTKKLGLTSDDIIDIGLVTVVAGNLILKSTSAKTVNGFGGISMNKLLTPYISATDMVFFENFGITVSGELLLSGNAPLRVGSWVFPSTTPPTFSKFILTRATIPSTPDASEFKELTTKNWQNR